MKRFFKCLGLLVLLFSLTGCDDNSVKYKPVVNHKVADSGEHKIINEEYYLDYTNDIEILFADLSEENIKTFCEKIKLDENKNIYFEIVVTEDMLRKEYVNIKNISSLDMGTFLIDFGSKTSSCGDLIVEAGDKIFIAGTYYSENSKNLIAKSNSELFEMNLSHIGLLEKGEGFVRNIKMSESEELVFFKDNKYVNITNIINELIELDSQDENNKKQIDSLHKKLNTHASSLLYFELVIDDYINLLSYNMLLKNNNIDIYLDDLEYKFLRNPKIGETIYVFTEKSSHQNNVLELDVDYAGIKDDDLSFSAVNQEEEIEVIIISSNEDKNKDKDKDKDKDKEVILEQKVETEKSTKDSLIIGSELKSENESIFYKTPIGDTLYQTFNFYKIKSEAPENYSEFLSDFLASNKDKYVVLDGISLKEKSISAKSKAYDLDNLILFDFKNLSEDIISSKKYFSIGGLLTNGNKLEVTYIDYFKE